jgi:opacity protein-like surface antigen
MIRRRIVWSIVLAAVLACSGNETVQPTPGPLDGDWSGVSSGLTAAFRFDQVDDKLQGRGTLSTVNASIPVGIRGSFVDSTVTFAITAAGSQGLTFTGTLTDPDTIDGQLDGSGFNAFPLTLHRD